jgi:hypothetical protein
MPNRFLYTELKMGGHTEYAVTFISGELSEYRSFETAADAERCVQELRPLRDEPPLYALIQFTLAGLGRLGRLGSAPTMTTEDGVDASQDTAVQGSPETVIE